MPQLPDDLDAVAVRRWCSLALDALGRERAEIDAINVYPIADGDTGTNLYLTLESAAAAVEAVFAAHETGATAPATADAVRAMAHGALIGARGNSGTILAQLLRGMAGVLADGGDAAHLRLALTSAADAARQAVAHPVEGTVLTVAAEAAEAARGEDPDLRTVVTAAYDGARAALARTPEQLAVLGRAGVVDAGGRGLVAVLGALVETVTGQAPVRGPRTASGNAAKAPVTVDGGSVVGLPVGGTPVEGVTEGGLPASAPVEGPLDCPEDGAAGPAFEVIYLLEARDEQVARLRTRLDALGDSLVVVGGDGLWHVHVHVDDAGAAVEAGVEAGRPYRIRITHFATESGHDVRVQAEPAQRAVVVVVPGDGLAGLCTEAGATTVIARPGEPPASGELVDAIRRAHAREVVLLPNDAALRHTAAAAAEQARTEGVRVALVPTRAAVQGIAALAVHEPDRGFDEDVVAMTAAAGATRYAELAVAERQSWTMAGICQAGDILGLIDGDVAVIGSDVPHTARTVLDRMLAAGGELVTLVLGEDVPDALADALEEHVREGHLAVDTVVYRGGHQRAPLLIGVE
ncbi:MULTISPECIES: DAK2 domain-containing protein [Streptomyces]|uniref:Dihydroxyacetone kinase n=1 Tax=Streptomyces rubiginosohelvolus TaxID=67362 RepID=A0ABQ3BBK4_9ACTN|nr:MULTISPECIES: DAK2 domain-containing protein [Streptomyces]RUP70044.1 DAK2 domain protein [Streptomyces sp. NP10]WST56119.1 DAK2 domain-containing protein [Streptomyces rubiginosohelvolus]GGS16259.1 dihydroxyacetone kinase [Streptomyces rubiginosohelvolus]GGZ32309.1 dihydroxyacetone kinase [Streptomyces pluricolorescens]